MRTDTGQVFRLEDYRPSPYLIPRDRPHLPALAGRHRWSIAKLTVERRDDAPIDAPLVLDGDGLTLKRLEIDGIERSRPTAFTATPDSLVIAAPPLARRFPLTIETELAPASNQALMGLYRSNGVYCTQCEAEGFRRITYFLDRPGHPVGLHGPHRGRSPAKRRCCCPTAIRSRPASSTAAGISPSGTTRSPSRPTCSRWWPAISAR